MELEKAFIELLQGVDVTPDEYQKMGKEVFLRKIFAANADVRKSLVGEAAKTIVTPIAKKFGFTGVKNSETLIAAIEQHIKAESEKVKGSTDDPANKNGNVERLSADYQRQLEAQKQAYEEQLNVTREQLNLLTTKTRSEALKASLRKAIAGMSSALNSEVLEDTLNALLPNVFEVNFGDDNSIQSFTKAGAPVFDAKGNRLTYEEAVKNFAIEKGFIQTAAPVTNRSQHTTVTNDKDVVNEFLKNLPENVVKAIS